MASMCSRDGSGAKIAGKWDYTSTHASDCRVHPSGLLGALSRRRAAAEGLVRGSHSATWTQPADIKAQYRSASVLKNRRVVFNIKGNDYRLIVAIAYKLQIVYVKFVGTHKEYDAVDAETVEMA
jgi:mRNA-degrading endonuclease HigB of HigAB toxin-antitoxin module